MIAIADDRQPVRFPILTEGVMRGVHLRAYRKDHALRFGKLLETGLASIKRQMRGATALDRLDLQFGDLREGDVDLLFKFHQTQSDGLGDGKAFVVHGDPFERGVDPAASVRAGELRR